MKKDKKKPKKDEPINTFDEGTGPPPPPPPPPEPPKVGDG